MSWDDIRYFLAVMRGGSLSAAARALQVQHSTVARRIDALESALGIRLFDRLPRGWPPTDSVYCAHAPEPHSVSAVQATPSSSVPLP